MKMMIYLSMSYHCDGRSYCGSIPHTVTIYGTQSNTAIELQN